MQPHIILYYDFVLCSLHTFKKWIHYPYLFYLKKVLIKHTHCVDLDRLNAENKSWG